jgi:hypothetical protein
VRHGFEESAKLLYKRGVNGAFSSTSPARRSNPQRRSIGDRPRKISTPLGIIVQLPMVFRPTLTRHSTTSSGRHRARSPGVRDRSAG